MIKLSENVKYEYGETKDGKPVVKITDGEKEAVVELLDEKNSELARKQFKAEMEYLESIRYVPQDLQTVAEVMRHAIKLNYYAFKLHANYMLLARLQEKPEQPNNSKSCE